MGLEEVGLEEVSDDRSDNCETTTKEWHGLPGSVYGWGYETALFRVM